MNRVNGIGIAIIAVGLVLSMWGNAQGRQTNYREPVFGFVTFFGVGLFLAAGILVAVELTR